MTRTRGLDQPVDERRQPLEMRSIEAVGAANGDADRMHGNGVVAREIEQQLRRVRIRQKVLRMDLEPSDGGTRGHHLGQVRQPQPDAGP